MGLCFSCCRRCRKLRHNGERASLLADPEQIRGVSKKAIDVVTALNAGKYPSQAQVDAIFCAILRSNLLRECKYGKLSDEGRNLLLDLRQICELVLIFGLEKNDDDRIQELLYHLSQVQPPVEAAASVIEDTSEALKKNVPPTHQIERDAYDFVTSSKLLFRLLVTSTAFRIILSTLASITQAAVTEIASEIGEASGQVREVAETVEHVAEGVEATAHDIEVKIAGDIDTSLSNLDNVAAQAQGVVNEVSNDAHITSTHSTRAVEPLNHVSEKKHHNNVPLAEAIQTMLYEARQHPKYPTAIETIIRLVEQYLNTFIREASETIAQEGHAAANLVVGPLENSLQDIQVIVERLASGKSLDPILHAGHEFLSSFATDDSTSDIRTYVADVRAFLVRAFSVSEQITSDVEKTDILQLIDQGNAIFKRSRSRNKAFDRFSVECHVFFRALRDDRTTSRMWRAFSTLLLDLEGYMSSMHATERVLHLSQRLWNDATTFVWTAGLALAEAVFRVNLSSRRGVVLPIPRVEYTDATVDVALDGRLMRVSVAASSDDKDATEDATSWLTPSVVHVKRWNELHVDFGAPSTSSAVFSSNKIHVHVEGLLAGKYRNIVSLNDISYYVRYKGLLGYEDEGVVGLDVDLPSGYGEGSLDLIFDLDASGEEQVTQLTVESVKINLPHSLRLQVELLQSKHWILNTLLTNPIVLPLATWFVKKQVECMMEGAVKSAVEGLGTLGNTVMQDIKKGKNLWCSLMDAIHPSEDEAKAQGQMTMKGVEVDLVQEHEAEERATSKLAVGLVPQLLPSKGEPEPLDSPDAAYNRIIEEAHDVEENVVAETIQAKQGVVDALHAELEDAPVRLSRGETQQEQTKKWRSDVFDIV